MSYEDEAKVPGMWEDPAAQWTVQLQEEETVSSSRSQHPLDKDPYDLRYDEAAGMLTDEELQVVTVDYSKRRR